MREATPNDVSGITPTVVSTVYQNANAVQRPATRTNPRLNEKCHHPAAATCGARALTMLSFSVFHKASREKRFFFWGQAPQAPLLREFLLGTDRTGRRSIPHPAGNRVATPLRS